jgi:hypothetical protein
MSTPRQTSNVYVLPASLSMPVPAQRSQRRLPIRLRWLTWWWRLRLTVREVSDALRRFGRPRSRATVDDVGADVVIPSAWRPAAGPAQVIEIAAARRRRTLR